MKHIFFATAATLITLAGTTSALAEITCEQLYQAALERDLVPEGDFTLTNPDGTTLCEFVEGSLVHTHGEDATGLSRALQNADPAATSGLLTALDATGALDGERGVDGQARAQGTRDQGGEQESRRAEQGGQHSHDGASRGNSGNARSGD